MKKKLRSLMITNSILIACLPILLIGIMHFILFRKHLEQDTAERNRHLVKTMTHSVNGFMKEPLNMLIHMRNAFFIQKTLSPAQLKVHLSSVLNEYDYFDYIGVHKYHKVRIGSYPAGADNLDFNGIVSTPLSVNKLNDEILISDVIIHRGNPVLIVDAPIKHGFIRTVLNLSTLGSNLYLPDSGKSGVSFIADSKGMIFSILEGSPESEGHDVAVKNLVKWSLAGNSGTHFFYSGNRSYIGTVEAMELMPWHVGIVNSFRDIYRPVAGIQIIILMSLLLSFLLALVLALKLVNSTTAPLQDFSEHARMIAAGEYSSTIENEYPYIEIDELSASFSSMIAAVQKREEKLISSEERFRAILNNAAVGISLVDSYGYLLQVNNRWKTMFGYTDQEISSLRVSDFTHRDDVEKSMEMIKELTGGDIDLYRIQKRYIRKDGSVFWADVSVTPILGRGGKVEALMGVVVDITDQREYETRIRALNETLEKRVIERTKELEESLSNLKQAQRHIIQTEKMATLGTLVAGVAHEINTPLGIGITASSYLKDQTDSLVLAIKSGVLSETEVEDYLALLQESSAIILSNLQRAGDLINSFKQVAVEQSRDDMHRFNLKEYVQDVVNSLNPRLRREKHSVALNIAEDFELVSYPGAFSQIITNLIINSLEHGFTDKTGCIISMDASTDDTSLYFSYSDNGKGAPREVVDHIFEPFYTTSRTEGGTGLGMHIVYNLVTQKLQGNIDCFSMPNKGISFNMIIPLDISGSADEPV